MFPCLLSTFLLDKTRQHSALNSTVVALTSTAPKKEPRWRRVWLRQPPRKELVADNAAVEKITAETGVAQTGVAEEHVAIKVLAENVSSGDIAVAEVDVNATVGVNIFTLEVAVEDISTEGEGKGWKTASESLLEKTGW